MVEVAEKVRGLLGEIGLSGEEMVIYVVLLEKGVMSALEVSKVSGITRTQVYRLLERMKEKGVVEEIVDEHRTLSKAVSVDRLERLFREKVRLLGEVEKSLPQIREMLTGVMSMDQPETRVKFYRGKQGISQMVWNVLEAREEVVGYTFRSFEVAVGKKLQGEFYEEMKLNGLKMRDVYSEEYVNSFGGIDKFVALMPSIPDSIRKQIVSRYVPPTILAVECQSDIYNDVVSFYNWYEGEVFGVEIYNPKVAKLQKQLFELVWAQAIGEDELLQRLKSEAKIKGKEE